MQSRWRTGRMSADGGDDTSADGMRYDAAFKRLVGKPGAIMCRVVPSGDESQEGSVQIFTGSEQWPSERSSCGSVDPELAQYMKGAFASEDRFADIQERSMEGALAPDCKGGPFVFLLPGAAAAPAEDAADGGAALLGHLPGDAAEGGAALLKRLPGVSAVHAKIGAGTFGEVFRCAVHGVEGDVAVKLLHKGSDISQKRELELLGQLRHSRLVHFHGVFHGPPAALVMELCEGGSLEDLLYGPIAQQGGLAGLGLPQRVRAVADVVSVVEYLHTQSVVHRDIKAGNVFLTGPASAPVCELPIVKLGGLGLARELGAAMTQCTGTFRYMAPEVLMSMSYGEPADVFSCGVLLYEVLSGKKPFGNLSGLRVAAAISTGARPEPADIGDGPMVEALGSILRASWADDPAERPTAAYLRECVEPLVPAC